MILVVQIGENSNFHKIPPVKHAVPSNDGKRPRQGASVFFLRDCPIDKNADLDALIIN